MVQPQMYCAEQIVVPENLQMILKTYAKAAIRTQPYDLLRWSAAYFRCIANNETPPVKPRLEKQSRFGALTKGYLRLLLEQVGKGFFIERDVLLSKWSDVSLPKEELLKFLSLCRMLHWPQIHWLKLFAVMVGTLNDNFKGTIDMICELLTNEPEGGPNPIPMWMFRECYIFVAELDCSEHQRFENGRKVLANEQLEDETPIPDVPRILSSESFRNAILEKWNERLGQELSYNPKRVLNDDEKHLASSTDQSRKSSESQISQNLRFVGDYSDPYEIIKKAPDFDSIILVMNEVRGNNIHDYPGPDHVSSKNIEHAKTRETELTEKHETQAKQTEENAQKQMDADKLELINRLEPPWSWIHQFATCHCPERSFNFLECETIKSNATPSESSDESFDLDREMKFESIESSDSRRAEIEAMLLKSETADKTKDEIEPVVLEIADNIIDRIIERVIIARDEGKLSIINRDSIMSILEEYSDDESLINLDKIRKYLQEAEDEKIAFNDLDELQNFLRERYSLRDDTKNTNEEEKEESVLDLTDIPIQERKEEEKSEEQLGSEVVEHPSSPPPDKIPLERKFEECDIEIDEKVMNKKISDNMILGLTQPPQPKAKSPSPEPEIEEEASEIESVTSLVDTIPKARSPTPTDVESEPEVIPTAPSEPELKFDCEIESIPGIGKTISQKTIIDFMTYLKIRSREEKGMVFPRHFRDKKCPHMIDTIDE